MTKPTRRKRSEPTPITEAIGYTRVSTQEQAVSGLGLEAQRARIEHYCAAKGWRLVTICEDAGASGKNLNREALKSAIAQLSPGRILVAFKLDRLTRTLSDLNTLTEDLTYIGSGWATVEGDYDTSTAMGRFVVDLVARIAQMEREVLAERTTAALGVKAVRGERLGTTPLGYRTEQTPEGPRIVSDEEGQKTVRMARQMRKAGKSLRDIALALTAAGRPTKRGKTWRASTVRSLIAPRYVERNQNAGG